MDVGAVMPVGAIVSLGAVSSGFSNANTNQRPPVTYKSTEADLEKGGYTSAEIKSMKASGKLECQTCANRTYQDGSDDAGVSFKTPTKLSPGVAAQAVTSHEMEHVNRSAAKAESEGKRASSTVAIFHDTCPECGRSYVSGGVTHTKTTSRSEAKQQDENDHFFNVQFGGADTAGKKVDKIA